MPRARRGRPAHPGGVPDLGDADPGRVQPAGLDEGALHRPGDDPVAADERAATVAISACTTAATTSAGTPARHRHPGEQRSTSASRPARTAADRARAEVRELSQISPASRGRPSRWSSTSPSRRRDVHPGERLERRRARRSARMCSVSAVARTAPAPRRSTGSGARGQAVAPRMRSRTTSTRHVSPVEGALARAPRTRDSAAASGIRRRSASCQRSRVQASRARRRVASGDAGSAARALESATVGTPAA